MPTITIRITKAEKANLEDAARSEGRSLSDYVRGALEVRVRQDDIDGLNVRVEELWRKVARLEEIAGL